MIEWQWAAFGQLMTDELYQVLRLRQQVFIVEQTCIYEDIDGLDQDAWHLIGWRVDEGGSRTVAAYLRVLNPGVKYKEASIGRVMVSQAERGTGLGKALMRQAMTIMNEKLLTRSIRISAQQHLEAFYLEFGFKRVSEPYDEDGIPHIEMLKV
ncbi:GNAT family N-acetyltransferase [Alkalimarinus sediminis]|uniref:GNAT family N-acetyltransferase n=1 Tax=Alkalimarinus sediminis TaxID=1632866 RepID=A0A9E8KR42_9ALTE|nr:GNAT family N-acetyltransferase [Alkalimarinus sediminis]UZW75592.1 GNAT family N-acetyltransferase [Alkalimarinus sediminis]